MLVLYNLRVITRTQTMQANTKTKPKFTNEQKQAIAAILTENMICREGYKVNWRAIDDRVTLDNGIYKFYFIGGGCWPIDREQFLRIKARHDRQKQEQQKECGGTFPHNGETSTQEPPKVLAIETELVKGSPKQKKWAIDTISKLQQACDWDYYAKRYLCKTVSFDKASDRQREQYLNYLECWNSIASHKNAYAAKYWIDGYGEYMPADIPENYNYEPRFIYNRIPKMANAIETRNKLARLQMKQSEQERAKARAIEHQNTSVCKQGDRARS